MPADNAKIDLADVAGEIVYEPDPYRAAEGAHAIAVLTEWSEYQELDCERVYASMEHPAFVFDGRNILDHHRLHEIGFNGYSLGRSPLVVSPC